MRLVVSGYYGHGNAGDEAVLAGLLRLLAVAGAERDEVTVLSGDPAQTERLHGVRAVSRWNPLRIATEVRRADGLLSGGGGLLQDVTSSRPVAYYAGVMELARIVRRPYAVVAQGLGPLRRRPNRRIARLALEGAAHVSMRDERSIALARRIGVRRPIHRAADPALAALSPRAEPTEGGAPVLFAVRGGYPADAVVGPLRHVVAALARRHRVVALPMHGALDRDASMALIGGIAGTSMVDPDAPPSAKLDAIAGASLVIGVRLHALVLAAAANVPAIAISYDPKVDAFARRAGIALIGSTDSTIDAPLVLAAVDEALGRGAAMYGERVAEMRAEVETDVRGALAAMGRVP